jgi:Fe-S cluster assembly protein SufD
MSVENIKEKQWYIDNFASFEKKLNGGKELFVHELRKDAISRFESLNFPTLKDEEWKYTSIAPILSNNFVPAQSIELSDAVKKEIEEKHFCGFECHKVVFVNGLFSGELSEIKILPQGVVMGGLSEIARSNPELVKKHLLELSPHANAFNALNNAFNLDGLFIYLPKGKVIDRPVQVLYLNGNDNEPVLVSPRNIIVAEERSEVNIIMNYRGVSENIYFTNVTTEISAEKGAIVNICKTQNENENAFHIEKVDVIQNESSIFNHYSMMFGGSIVRNDINSKLDGENCECHYYGLYLGGGRQHIDNHTFVDHAKPNCLSNELYKGILDGESRGVFSGKIMVRPDAQKTNAYQSNKTILLSDKATIDTKPQLEIYADDVKCSHGATIGHLDETAYFYIRSRGVPAEHAKSMLIRAFANDVIESIKTPELKEKLNHMIFDHLHRVEINNQ